MSTAGTLETPSREIAGLDAETKARWLWVSLVVGLLAFQVLACLVAALLAMSSPAVVTVPNYYEKSLQWDEHRAELAASQRLGWSATIHFSEPVDIFENRTISVRLTDAQSTVVPAETVSLKAWHHAAANQLVDVELAEVAPGFFQGKLRMKDAGWWQFELQASQGEQTFLDSQKLQLKKN